MSGRRYRAVGTYWGRKSHLLSPDCAVRCASVVLRAWRPRRLTYRGTSMSAGPGPPEARIERGHQVLGVLHPSRRHPHAPGQVAEVELGVREVEESPRHRPAGIGAHPVQLHVQDGVAPVGQHDRRHVQTLRGPVSTMPAACTWRSRQPPRRAPAAPVPPTAAPVARGSPIPMAPPVRVSQSCRGAPAVAPAMNRPDVLPSSTTIVPSGRVAPTAAARDSAERPPVGRPGRPGGAGTDPVRRCAHGLGQSLQSARRVLAGTGQRVDGAARRHKVARLAGVREEGHRGLGVHQDEVAHAVELGLGHLGQVRQPLHGRDARPPFQVGRERLTQQCGTRRGGDAAGGVQPVGAERGTAHEQCRSLA